MASHAVRPASSRAAALGLALAVLLSGACSSPVSLKETGGVKLTGLEEVPPVATEAAGISSITVGPDGSVAGAVSTTNLVGTAAHIHLAPAGANGPVIVPLAQTANGVWSVPAGARLTTEQLTAWRSGGLYVNVHSDAHKGGEIRAQLKP
jgi:hypothetical protein